MLCCFEFIYSALLLKSRLPRWNSPLPVTVTPTVAFLQALKGNPPQKFLDSMESDMLVPYQKTRFYLPALPPKDTVKLVKRHLEVYFNILPATRQNPKVAEAYRAARASHLKRKRILAMKKLPF
jgi:hypothetical protein